MEGCVDGGPGIGDVVPGIAALEGGAFTFGVTLGTAGTVVVGVGAGVTVCGGAIGGGRVDCVIPGGCKDWTAVPGGITGCGALGVGSK